MCNLDRAQVTPEAEGCGRFELHHPQFRTQAERNSLCLFDFWDSRILLATGLVPLTLVEHR